MSGLKELDKFLMKHVLAGTEGAEAAREFYKARARSEIAGRIAKVGKPLDQLGYRIGPHTARVLPELQKTASKAHLKYLESAVDPEVAEGALARWARANGYEVD
jgi:hypothetical protein